MHRWRDGDPSLLKPRSANNNLDNDALIASASKNDKDHLRSSLGLRMTVELPVQPEAKRQRGGGRGGGGGDKKQCNNQPVQMKWGGKDERVRWGMTRGQDDLRGRRANKVQGSRMGNNRGKIHQQE